jgi:hypothetical protein
LIEKKILEAHKKSAGYIYGGLHFYNNVRFRKHPLSATGRTWLLQGAGPGQERPDKYLIFGQAVESMKRFSPQMDASSTISLIEPGVEQMMHHRRAEQN